MKNIPVFHVVGRTIAEAWEKAVLVVAENGIEIRTEYDKKNPDGSYVDPPSRDATVVVEVTDPLGEPRIHKNFPGGPSELEVYRQEVIDGIHDHWIDPKNDMWTYTYHERLFSYCVTEDLQNPDSPRPFKSVDQMGYIVDRLVETFHTRRAQAVTWMPTADPVTYDPPCLQRIWCRVVRDESGAAFMNMNTHWRSRDAYKAWFMNVYALTDLQRIMAERISEKCGETVLPGRYVDIVDSLHIYGSYLAEAEPEIAKMKADPDFTKRAWNSDDEIFVEMTNEAKDKLKADPDFMRSQE